MAQRFALCILVLAALGGCNDSDFSGDTKKAEAPAAGKKPTATPSGQQDGEPLGKADSQPGSSVPAATGGDLDPGTADATTGGNGPSTTGGTGDGTVTPGAATSDPALDPAPSTAQQKGSFRIWSVPADPAPYQEYQVVVEVTLPSGATAYDRGDLAGDIKGTEGWFEWTLGSDKHKPAEFQKGGNKARLITWIPGDDAVEGYGDIITVRSTLLGESQAFDVTF